MGSAGAGMTRLGALAEGVKQGVWSREEVAVERALSLLRERLDEEGDGGTCNEFCGCDMLASVLTPPMSLALRRRARSLCSLKSLRSAPGEAAGSGKGGTTKLEVDGMVAATTKRSVVLIVSCGRATHGGPGQALCGEAGRGWLDQCCLVGRPR